MSKKQAIIVLVVLWTALCFYIGGYIAEGLWITTAVRKGHAVYGPDRVFKWKQCK